MKKTEMKELGTGVLDWEADICSHGPTCRFYLTGGQERNRAHLENRSNTHIQLFARVDEFLEMQNPKRFSSTVPKIPKVGEVHMLCEGLFSVCGDAICYKPNEEKGKTFFNSGLLVTLRGHPVTLLFKEHNSRSKK